MQVSKRPLEWYWKITWFMAPVVLAVLFLGTVIVRLFFKPFEYEAYSVDDVFVFTSYNLLLLTIRVFSVTEREIEEGKALLEIQRGSLNHNLPLCEDLFVRP